MVLHHLLLLTTLKEDHENDKIVIKVPKVHDEENNYNLHECCHYRHLCLLIICFDHEHNKIVIKVPEVYDEENNYNLYECCHSRPVCLPHHMLRP